MQGEKDLHHLLAQLTPVLQPGVYVYCSLAEGETAPDCQYLALFHEQEGLTMILELEEAERLSIPYTYPCRCVTLTIHSDLEAVGLLACVTATLAEAGISCNVVSAFYHDHLFVPNQAAEKALALLLQLQENAAKRL